ncbi:peroxisome assembly protein 22 [Diutina catenulata]
MAISLKKAQKNPQLWLAAAAVTTLVALGYKVYENLYATDEVDTDGKPVLRKSWSSTRINKYTNKSIALTLSHSILNSQLPLHDILQNAENVTFILPPNLSEDDLEYNIHKQSVEVPAELMNNYKLLKCQNIQGYFTVLKNLKPDLLLMCQDDLGLSTNNIPKDLSRFIKKIIFVDQSNDDISTKVAPLFVH